MKTLTKNETKQVSGGLFVATIVLIYEELLIEAMKDLAKGNLVSLGELENRPTGTRP
ncbi:bacteriocin [Psychrosphaera aestuarii]|uniref:bacteriocin n=1 Tax=Psychrosphaera aestuarii TaxID=1266052 RepID=UPI001B33003D|nr:bacteriocin [Psychrosphaera aestuarii]